MYTTFYLFHVADAHFRIDLQATPLTDETKKKILSDYEKYDIALEEKKKRHREKNPDRYSQDVEDEQNLFYKSLIGMCVMSYWYVCYVLLVCVLCLIGMCVMSYCYVCYVLLVCVLCLIGMCVRSYWYVCYVLLVCVLCLIGMCVMSYLYVCYVCVLLAVHGKYLSLLKLVIYLILLLVSLLLDRTFLRSYYSLLKS